MQRKIYISFEIRILYVNVHRIKKKKLCIYIYKFKHNIKKLIFFYTICNVLKTPIGSTSELLRDTVIIYDHTF